MTKKPINIGTARDRANFVTLDSCISKGEQGETWRAHSTARKELQYVVKICRTPTGTAGTSIADFERECDVLSKLTHPNIVRIVDSGTELVRGNKRLDYPFYIMEFLGFDVVTLKKGVEKATPSRRLLLTLCALKDAAAALAYVHRRGDVHGDVKESNILISNHESLNPQNKLIDFGFSRHLVPSAGHRKPKAAVGPQARSSFRRSHDCKTDQHSDIFQLCCMVRQCLEKCPPPDEVPHEDKKYWPIDYALFPRLETLLAEWASEKPASKPDTAEIQEFYDQLAGFTPTYELSPDVRGALVHVSIPEIATTAQILQAFEAIRIPPRQLVLYTENIKKLITTPQFGALRYVRQLGFTHLVYPGAQGTRFEHSLGMYDLACQVVIRMSGDPEFRNACENKRHVLKFILAALLHDVGHFPFAHQLEEFQRHDFHAHDQARVENLIEGHHYRGRKVITELAGTLNDLFSLDSVDLEDIKWLVFPSEQDRGTSKPPALLLFRRLLDGPIDLDKLDYIERDAHHCGVPYGSYLDIARLKETIRVLERKDKPVLAFDSRVVGSLEQFATARHELYANVYWHRAVRSATVMFKHAFYLFQGLIRNQAQLEDMFYHSPSDDCLLYTMTEHTNRILARRSLDEGLLASARAVLRLLRAVSGKERVLYKALLEKERVSDESDIPYGQQVYRVQREKAQAIFEQLRKGGFVKKTADDLGEHNLLIDCHTDPFPSFEEIRIIQGSPRKTTSLGKVAPSVNQLKVNFRNQACKIRVFVNPEALAPRYQSKDGRTEVTKFLRQRGLR